MDISNLHQVEFAPKVTYSNAISITRLFFVIVFYMIVFGIVGGFPVIVFKAYSLKSPLFKPILKLIIYLSTMLVAIKYAIRKSKQGEGGYFNINFDKVPVWLFPVIIICTLALVVFLMWVSSLIPMPVSVHKYFEKMFTKDVFSLITAVIAAPILEEILCRGIVLRGLLKSYPVHKAILISATFFALLHLNPWQALPAFFGGIFIGWVYYKTQSVIPGMVIHATINATASVALFLPHQKYSSSFHLEPNYYIVLVFALIIFFIGCRVIQKKLPTAIAETDS